MAIREDTQHRHVAGGSRSSASKFRPDIQGLRAIAVLAVILYHAGSLLPGGFLGVDVFFVISGFVITRSLTSEHARTGRISLLDFYRRRVYRLTPMLIVAVTVVVLASIILGPLAAIDGVGQAGMAASFLVANLFFAREAGYFGPAAELNPLLHTWSLSLEEQFYLVYPALVLGLYWIASKRGKTTWATIMGGLAVTCLGSLLLGLLLSYGPALPSLSEQTTRRLAFFAMPARAWQFGVGAIVALADDRRSSARHQRAAVGLMGVAGLTGCFALIVDGMSYPGLLAPLPTFFTACVIWNKDGPVARFLSQRAFVRMGDVSYSWYLWHWPAIVFLGAAGQASELLLAVAGLSTYPLAAFTYERVEQRYRSLHRTHSWLYVTAMSFTIGLGLYWVSAQARSMIWRELPDTAALAQHADRVCTPEELAPDVSGCSFGGGGERIALIGDSNAGHFSEALIHTARVRASRLMIATISGCPVLDLQVFNDGIEDEGCRTGARAIRDWLMDSPPDLLVVAMASDIHVGRANRVVVSGDLQRADAYERALTDFVSRLQQVGTKVLLIHPVPKFQLYPGGRSGPAECSALVLSIRADLCDPKLARAEAEARRMSGMEVETSVARALSVATFDPFELLCTTSSCPALVEGDWLYRDSRHISVAASEMLGPAVSEIVANALGDP